MRRAPQRHSTTVRGKSAHHVEFSRIGGLRAVAALFAVDPARVERLFFLPVMRVAAEPFARTLGRARKPFREVAPDELARIAGTILHGGIVAVARPKPVLPFDPIEARQWSNGPEPLLILDGIGNPHNLGAIGRSAAYFGVQRLVLSARPEQAGPSDAAMRVSEGGLERLALFRASDLPAALRGIAGTYRVVAATPGGGPPPQKVPRDLPIALVLGNEEEGLPKSTLAACTHRVTIPGAGIVESLNVAAAAAILIHAFAATSRG